MCQGSRHEITQQGTKQDKVKEQYLRTMQEHAQQKLQATTQ